jgi:hypothetical protein
MGPEFIFVLAPFNDARSVVSIEVNDKTISRYRVRALSPTRVPMNIVMGSARNRRINK